MAMTGQEAERKHRQQWLRTYARDDPEARATSLGFHEGLSPPDMEPKTAGSLDYIYEAYTNLADNGLLMKKIVRFGNGVKLVPGSFMKIHYQVFSFDTTGQRAEKPFDSSLERDDQDGGTDRLVAVPKEYTLMEGEVIGVLDVGVATMEVKEIANFVAGGIYAYGSYGIPKIVQKNAPVFVQVQVLEGLEPTIVNQILKDVLVDKSKASLDEIYEAVSEFRERGNKEYAKKHWREAIRNYKLGVKWVDGTMTMHPADVRRFTSMHYGLMNNMVACYNQMRHWQKAIQCCFAAIALPEKPEHIAGEKEAKLYFRLAYAQYEMKDYKGSMKSIKIAKDLEPYNAKIVWLHKKLVDREMAALTTWDDMWRNIALGYVNNAAAD